MAYKTKAEKRAWRKGLFAGLFGRKKKKDASKVNPYSEQRDAKLEAKRKEFLRLGGGRSGVYDVSKPDVAKFVREYKDFIHKNEIYKRDKHNCLVPVYKRR